MSFNHRNFLTSLALTLTLAVGSVATAVEPGAEQGTREQQMEHKFEKAERYYAECQAVEEGEGVGDRQ